MKKINLREIPELDQRSPAGRFHSHCRDISIALGCPWGVGPWGGGHPFDVQVRRVPPGAAVCPFHSHSVQWELFVVRSGTGTVRAGGITTTVAAGETFIHPPNEPHQIVNDGTVDLVLLIVADNPQLDATHYPDSDKWGLRPPGRIFRTTAAGYFDGEEPASAGATASAGSTAGAPAGAPTGAPVGARAGAPARPPPPPPLPPILPFEQRRVRPDDLPWVMWESPKGRFRGRSKELSLAMGALRRTPVGLGGHPFDLELTKLEPGETPCPYHSHAAQWEMFVILGGSATVRTPSGEFTVGADDIVLQEPGDTHQIRNTGSGDLTFFLIANDPPVDIWHYPDSGKWGTSHPRKFFRTEDADYWDGEE